MSQEDQQIIDAADVNDAVRTWMQRAMVVVVGAIVFGVSTMLGWPWIKELVRGEDIVRSVPVLEQRIKALEGQVAEAQRATAANAVLINDLIRFFPRRPDPAAWSAIVVKP